MYLQLTHSFAKMHHTVRKVVFVCLLLGASAQRVEIPHKHFTTLAEGLADAERYMLQFNETFNFPSLAFGMAVRGKPVIRKAWGRADLENSVAAKLSTKYRLASVSKSFTSAILGRLVDRGLVHYDDPLSKYLSGSIFPPKKWPVKEEAKAVNITLRQLLCHSGGVHVDSEDWLQGLRTVFVAQNVTQTVAQYRDVPLQFTPGSHFNYSNYGFQLLGAVIEAVSKRPYPAVAADFLRAAGLRSTFIGNMSVVLHDVPRYYTAVDVNNLKENVPTLPFDELFFVEGMWPAGGYISTVDDLLAYGQLLIDSYKGRPNAILSQKTIREMWSPQINVTGIDSLIHSQYAFGWFVADGEGGNGQLKHRHILWHSGHLLGSSSMLFIYPDEEVVAVAFTNKGDIHVLERMIAYTVENVYHLVK